MKVASILYGSALALVAFAAPPARAFGSPAVMKGIDIVIKQKPGAFQAHAKTDAQGGVSFTRVPAGKYVVTIAPGQFDAKKVKVDRVVVSLIVSNPRRPSSTRFTTLAKAKSGLSLTVSVGATVEVHLYPDAKSANPFSTSNGGI